ncbi:MAG: M23 family metallopeptidase [Rhodospirillaceae bacterium]|nr:M23 family metallopeptidase [Rhodospirillaceae bacterium]
MVIGYVGASGRSTGPPLHYEILKNNRRMNPRRLNLPSCQRLRRSFTTAQDASIYVSNSLSLHPFCLNEI